MLSQGQSLLAEPDPAARQSVLIQKAPAIKKRLPDWKCSICSPVTSIMSFRFGVVFD